MKSSIIAKMMSLLTIVSEARKPLSFSELVVESGLNKSSLHRVLAICAEENVIQYDKARKVYVLGPKIFDLARNAFQGFDIQALALDEMLRLHALFDGNVTLGVPQGMEVVYLRIVEAKTSIGQLQYPGMREPIHCSASGKALMAFLPDKVIAARLDQYVFMKFTDRTIMDSGTFIKELKSVREAGFASNDREEYDHFCGISAPIFNYLSEPVAVLNIWAVQAKHPISELKQWAVELRNSAHRITKLVGGVAPSPEYLVGG